MRTRQEAAPDTMFRGDSQEMETLAVNLRAKICHELGCSRQFAEANFSRNDYLFSRCSLLNQLREIRLGLMNGNCTLGFSLANQA